VAFTAGPLYYQIGVSAPPTDYDLPSRAHVIQAATSLHDTVSGVGSR
jgi:hypothetical protein